MRASPVNGANAGSPRHAKGFDDGSRNPGRTADERPPIFASLCSPSRPPSIGRGTTGRARRCRNSSERHTSHFCRWIQARRLERAVIARARTGEERLAGRSYLSRGMSSCDVRDRQGERQRYSGESFGDGKSNTVNLVVTTSPLPMSDSGSPLVADPCPALQLPLIERDTPVFEIATNPSPPPVSIAIARTERVSMSECGRRLGLSRESA
jgi:hypothetical protein